MKNHFKKNQMRGKIHENDGYENYKINPEMRKTEKEIPIEIIQENFSEHMYILFQTEKVYIKKQIQ